jgi:predicted RNA-binding Zn-ribbon protein involved in translation (DUF1610 family)
VQISNDELGRQVEVARNLIIQACRNGTAIKMKEEATYTCDSCGEEIIVPINASSGSSQEYVEDCPVCWNPNVIHVEIDEDGGARIWGEAEQDRSRNQEILICTIQCSSATYNVAVTAVVTAETR